MDKITFAELNYNRVVFVVVQMSFSPQEMALRAGGVIELLAGQMFFKPVILATKYLGKWMLAGDEQTIALANHFDLDDVRWKTYALKVDESATTPRWEHRR